MILTSLRYAAALALSLVLSAAVGQALLSLLGTRIKRPIASFFAALCFGLVAEVTLYSLFVTRGLSVNAGFLVLGAAVIGFFRARPRAPIDWRAHFSNYGELALVAGLGFARQLFTILPSRGSFFQLPQTLDIMIFSDLASFLAKTGQENPQIDFIHPKHLGVAPYHYFELWVGAAVSRVFGLLTLGVNHLVVPALFGAIVYFGVCAIIEQRRRLSPAMRALALASVFLLFDFTAFVPDRLPVIGQAKDYFNLTVLDYVKLAPVGLSVLGASFLMGEGNSLAAAIALLAGMIANIMVAPAFAATIAFMTAVGWWRGSISKADAKRVAVVSGVVIGFIVAFYAIFKGTGSFERPPGAASIVAELLRIEAAKRATHVLAASALDGFISMLPCLALLVVFRRSVRASGSASASDRRPNDGAVAMLLAAIAGFGAAAWASLHWMFVSHQLFTRAAAMVFTLGSLLITLRLLSSVRDGARRVVVGVVLVLFASKTVVELRALWLDRTAARSSYSSAFVAEVAARAQYLNPLGVYLRAPEEYDSIPERLPSGRVGRFTGLIDSALYTMSISVFDMPLAKDPADRAFDESSLRKMPFFEYVQEQKAAGRFVSVAKSQVDFIDELRVSYAILSPGARLPELLARRAGESLKDPVSGEKFVLLTR